MCFRESKYREPETRGNIAIARGSQPRALARTSGASRELPTVDRVTDYSIRSRWSRLQKHFDILTDGSRRDETGASAQLYKETRPGTRARTHVTVLVRHFGGLEIE